MLRIGEGHILHTHHLTDSSSAISYKRTYLRLWAHDRASFPRIFDLPTIHIIPYFADFLKGQFTQTFQKSLIFPIFLRPVRHSKAPYSNGTGLEKYYFLGAIFLLPRKADHSKIMICAGIPMINSCHGRCDQKVTNSVPRVVHTSNDMMR